MIRSTSFVLAICMFAGYVVAQTAEELVPTLEIDTLLNNGPKDNRINYAFGNIRPNDVDNPYPQKSDLLGAVQALLPYFDPNDENGKLGFSQYRNFFNLYSVWFPDPVVYEAVPAYYQLTQAVRDELFLPWSTESYGWITMVYTGGGGNGVGLTRELRVADGTLSMDWETVLHEFSHTMPGVFDEYTASGEWSNYVPIESANLTGQNSSIDKIPWRKWIDPGTPLPTPYNESYFGKVGLFEGNISGFFGAYRPTARSCYMGAGGFGENFGRELCSVCLQRFICMTYQYVDVIENPLPATSTIEVNGSESINFSANFVKPEPNTQKYEWFLNGVLIDTGKEAITVDFDACESYQLELVVTDTTELVRYDEKFKHFYPEPKQTHSWTIQQNAVSGYDLSAVVTTVQVDCSVMGLGSIQIDASGGLSPYYYILDGEEVGDNLVESLEPGIHQVVVADANGCSINETIEVIAGAVFDFEICTGYIDGQWILSAEPVSPNETLSYSWSTSENSPTIVVDSSGTYGLELTNSEGCIRFHEITLQEETTLFAIDQHISYATNGENNGAIYLDISGGAPPYAISWYRASGEDQTSPDDTKVFASNVNPWTPATYAFDNNFEYSEDFWAEEFTGANYVGFDFGTPITIDLYTFMSNVDTKERDPKSWKFQGSMDGQTWTDLDVITFFEFPQRLQLVDFPLSEPATYTYFRVLFLENWGSDRLVVQEFEFSQYQYEEISAKRNQKELNSIGNGIYQYEIHDLNRHCVSETLNLKSIAPVETPVIELVDENGFLVSVDNPQQGLSYYWSKEADGSDLTHIGGSFQPPSPGNYFVKSYNDTLSALVGEIKGFSVFMESSPDLQSNGNEWSVVDPKEVLEYHWYDQPTGGNILYTGTSYTPLECGEVYVSAKSTIQDTVVRMAPESIPGMTLWMDASDLDGDGLEDQGRVNSSAYDWTFRVGGSWNQDSWFPYRANYQNGHGIVDFSTMWYQGLSGGTNEQRTIIMAYQESSFSLAQSAPFHGLRNNIPRHTDSTQLLANDAPTTTLNGKVYLNGELVDPLATANPMTFVVLSVVYTNLITDYINASDEFWEGKLGELIVWNVELSEEQIAGVNAYMKDKWLHSFYLESPRVAVTTGTSEIVDLGPDLQLCNGSAATLDAGPDYLSYEWSNGMTTQAIEVTEAGDYSVVVTEVSGCTRTDELAVTVVDIPVVDLGPDASFCAGEEVTLTPGPDFISYEWNDGSSSSDLSVSVSGVYSVTVTNENGCTASDEISINFNELPSVSLGEDTELCTSEVIILNAGPGFSSYEWNDGSSTSDLSVSVSGVYSVTVTDENGCTASDEITITFNELPSVSLGEDAELCTNESLTLNAGTGFTSYQWSTGETTASIDIDEGSTYSVEVTDGNGCTAADTITITQCVLEVSPAYAIQLYPNPATKEVFVQAGSIMEEMKVEIYNLSGSQMKSKLAQNVRPGSIIRFDLTDLPPAVYLLYVNGKGAMKLIVSH